LLRSATAAFSSSKYMWPYQGTKVQQVADSEMKDRVASTQMAAEVISMDRNMGKVLCAHITMYVCVW